jgi:hypothetical protein
MPSSGWGAKMRRPQYFVLLRPNKIRRNPNTTFICRLDHYTRTEVQFKYSTFSQFPKLYKITQKDAINLNEALSTFCYSTSEMFWATQKIKLNKDAPTY